MTVCVENKKVTRVRAGEFLMTLVLVIPFIIGCSGHLGTSKNEAILTAENLIWTRFCYTNKRECDIRGSR